MMRQDSDQNLLLTFWCGCFDQQAVFEMVGLPMVENCLAGFNSSIFAYGQVLHLLMDPPTNFHILELFNSSQNFIYNAFSGGPNAFSNSWILTPFST